jgi:hypothetical protein
MIRLSLTFSAILFFFLGGVALGWLISDMRSVNEQRQVIGPDQYTFGEPQYVKDYSYIRIVKYDTFAALAISAKQHGFKMWQAVRAFAVQDSSPLGPCTVHIVDPKISYNPDYFGHEALHCFYGNWHRNAGMRNQTTVVPDNE